MGHISAFKNFLNRSSPRLYSLLKKCYFYINGVIFEPALNSVAIEINSFCNRKCRYCPNHDFEREKVFLDEKLFYKIISELKDMGFKGAIAFHQYNEPLLDPRLCKFIRHVRNELPLACIYLNTNGDLLNLDLWKELRASGLDRAKVTQYDGKINDNIQQLLNELDPEERKHISVNFLSAICNRAGMVRNDYTGELPLRKPCFRPSDQLCINYKGKAVLCCNDYFGSVEIADARYEKIPEIWKNRIFKYYRKKLTLGDRGGLKMCDKCDLVW